jgi:hypothetical protein
MELPVTPVTHAIHATHWFLGWGFTSDAQPQSYANCWEQVALPRPPQGICCAVLKTRLATPAWQALQRWMAGCWPQVQWLVVDAAEIAHIVTPSMSPRVAQRFGTGSVCEALALHAAQTHAVHMHEAPIPGEAAAGGLLVPRIVSEDRCATLAIAAGGLSSPPFPTGVHS